MDIQEGSYGGRILPFLALPDLIHSKETERAGDWQDVAILEEFLDARLLAQVEHGRVGLVPALAQLRFGKADAHVYRLARHLAGDVDRAAVVIERQVGITQFAGRRVTASDSIRAPARFAW